MKPKLSALVACLLVMAILAGCTPAATPTAVPPTVAPTSAPTVAPTAAPTKAPAAPTATTAPAPTAAPTAPPAGVTLQLWYANSGWTNAFTAMSAAAGKEIGVQTSLVFDPDPASLTTRLNAALLTDKKPDLFFVGAGANTAKRVDAGQVAETSSVWRDAIASGDLTKGLGDGLYTYNGKQYCVPINVAPLAMYYNKAVFSQYGLSVPKTWDDLMAISAKLKSAGVTPLLQESEFFPDYWFEILLSRTDPDLYKRVASGQTPFTDPAVVEVMKVYKSLFDQGFLTGAGTTYTQGADLLKTGKVAMAPYGTFYTAALTKAGLVLGKDFATFPIPPMKAGKPAPITFNSSGLCAATGSPQLASALKYLAWSVSKNAHTIFIQQTGEIPFNPKAAIVDPALADVAAALSSDLYQPLPSLRALLAPNVAAAVQSSLTGFIANPSSYADALKKMQESR
jgi:multiple sugar transport system substrate-binding protein